MSLPNPSSQAQDKPEHFIAEIMVLLAKVSKRFEPDDGEMRQWMVEHFQNPKVIELLQETTFMMLRVVDAIGELEPVNGITISKQYGIPKGSVSKSTRRLLTQKLIETETLPNNKKEVFFRLTPLGRELFLAHRAFDKAMEFGFIRFLQNYNDAELGFIVKVLQDLNEVSFLNLSEE